MRYIALVSSVLSWLTIYNEQIPWVAISHSATQWSDNFWQKNFYNKEVELTVEMHILLF
jgi:biopolymer transport protein ExbB/TolQ